MGEPRRREIPQIPYDALREAIINAVAHRNYFEQGANIMVEMFDDRIEITNPGGFPKGLKPEDFGKKSVLRNPNIANLLQRIGYLEKMGTGISKMRHLMDEAGLDLIEFEFGTFFTATFKRPEPAKRRVSAEVFGVNFSVKFSVKGKQLSKMVAIIAKLAEGMSLRIGDVAGNFGVTERTLYQDMKRLRDWDIIEFAGPAKTGRYQLTEKGEHIIQELSR